MSDREISSIKDPAVLEARALQSAKGRRESHRFLIEGEEQVQWALDEGCSVEFVFVHDKLRSHPLVNRIQQASIPVLWTSEGVLKKVSDSSYLIPFVGVGAVAPPRRTERECVVVLDGVQDHGNIGTIVRTGTAFGIQEFMATGEEFDWYYKKTIDASRGTVFAAQLTVCSSPKEAIALLRAKGYQIAVTTLSGSTLQSLVKLDGRPLAIVLGNETHGASAEFEAAADVRVLIPMSGAVESLNVGVAAGITLYELQTQLVLSMLVQKIQSSVARNLRVTADLIRQVFDAKLREVAPISADQAVIMMMLKCEGSLPVEQLIADAGALTVAVQTVVQPLVDLDAIQWEGEQLSLTEKGCEILAKVWPLHALTERLVREGIAEADWQVFEKVLRQMQSTCTQLTSN